MTLSDMPFTILLLGMVLAAPAHASLLPGACIRPRPYDHVCSVLVLRSEPLKARTVSTRIKMILQTYHLKGASVW